MRLIISTSLGPYSKGKFFSNPEIGFCIVHRDNESELNRGNLSGEVSTGLLVLCTVAALNSLSFFSFGIVEIVIPYYALGAQLTRPLPKFKIGTHREGAPCRIPYRVRRVFVKAPQS